MTTDDDPQPSPTVEAWLEVARAHLAASRAAKVESMAEAIAAIRASAAEDERAAIVAWLRDSDRTNLNVESRGLSDLADCIERGEHRA